MELHGHALGNLPVLLDSLKQCEYANNYTEENVH